LNQFRIFSAIQVLKHRIRKKEYKPWDEDNQGKTEYINHPKRSNPLENRSSGDIYHYPFEYINIKRNLKERIK